MDAQVGQVLDGLDRLGLTDKAQAIAFNGAIELQRHYLKCKCIAESIQTHYGAFDFSKLVAHILLLINELAIVQRPGTEGAKYVFAQFLSERFAHAR